jgi:replicative DNA helicase
MKKENYYPNDEHLECVVLGILLTETEAMPRVAEELEEHLFFRNENKYIYRAIRALYDAGSVIDVLTVPTQVLKTGVPEKLNAPLYVMRLSAMVTDSVHLEEHVRILWELSVRRETVKRLTICLARTQDMNRNVHDELEKLVDTLDRLRQGRDTNSLRALPCLIDDALEQGRQRKANNRDGLTGIPTGFTELDRLTAGWQKSELIVIGARPSTGKTSLTAYMAWVAAQAGYKVAYFSLEMAAERLADKWLVAQTNISADNWRRGTVTPEEEQAIAAAEEKLKAPAIYVDDTTVISMERIRSKCRTLQRQGQCDIVFIDYLQLALVTGSKPNHTMATDIGEMATKAKALAKELKIPAIVLSQLNRESEKRAGKRPAMHDLKESGGIEQVADVVALIHNPAKAGLKSDPKTGYPTEGLGILLVEKNRNGATGEIYYGYNESMTRFGDYELPKEWIPEDSRGLTAKEIRGGEC